MKGNRLLRRIILIVMFALLSAVGTADAEGWNTPYKVRVFEAALRFAPTGLLVRLDTSASAVQAAVEQADTQTSVAPQQRFDDAVNMLREAGADKKEVLVDLVWLGMSVLEKMQPAAAPAFFDKVDQSPAIARVRFDGYHEIKNLAEFLSLTAQAAKPRVENISNQVVGDDQAMADDLTHLFNLYANAIVDVWVTAAKQAELALGEPQPPGVSVIPPVIASVYRPEIMIDLTAEMTRFTQQGESRGVLAQLTIESATVDDGGNGDEFVFDEGVSITSDEAQAGAQQLAHSNVHVDSGGVDSMKGLDEEALAALKKLGIDVNSTHREFRGTRGGVKPGQNLRIGSLDFNLDNILSVEIGTREKRRVFMQLSDSALGTGAAGGRLNQKVVGAVFNANVGAFKTCFERRLRERPDLAGRVFVEFTINLEGLVSSVKILENTTGDSVFAECLSRQVQRLRFPPPIGGEVTFVFPFIFEQSFGF